MKASQTFPTIIHFPIKNLLNLTLSVPGRKRQCNSKPATAVDVPQRIIPRVQCACAGSAQERLRTILRQAAQTEHWRQVR